MNDGDEGSLALLTDLYQLTMAYGYWKNDRHQRNAVFHLFFRQNPFGGGYAVAAGLQPAMEILSEFHFSKSDIDYLATLRGNDSEVLFESGFLKFLGELRLDCDIDAIAEGTVVFPHEPLVRIRGSILQCQILETFLLNAINFPTLIATKAARVCQAAAGDPVLEFGLRRAQGIDGALSASRSAFVGGCAATSNVLAGKRFGIPVRGTHAHSWIMSYDNELDAFREYAAAMPNNCIFLVDTYDSIQGIRHAIEVADELRQSGHEMIGIRLDSGDLAELSIRARAMFDEAGYPDARIVASNDLDEYEITRLKSQGARIDTWGVGTKLVTAYEQPALGGVYKLAKMQHHNGTWHDRIKLSEQRIKISNPGTQQVRRFYRDGEMVADVIFDLDLGIDGSDSRAIDLSDQSHGMSAAREMGDVDSADDLLVPVMRQGKVVYDFPTLEIVQRRTHDQLATLPRSVKQLTSPEPYRVAIDQQLFGVKESLIESLGAKSE